MVLVESGEEVLPLGNDAQIVVQLLLGSGNRIKFKIMNHNLLNHFTFFLLNYIIIQITV